MLFEWLNFFSESSLMEEMRDRYMGMINNAHWMFYTMGKTMLENGDPTEHEEELIVRLKQLNESEARIRRMVVEHLTINPSNDLGVCLILFTGVREVERLGEFSMDLQHLAVAKQPYPEDVMPKLQEVFETVQSHFQAVGRCFSAWDKEAADAIIAALNKVQEECDELVDNIMTEGDDQGAHSAVAAALTLRDFRQVAVLITNIASSVVNPVHEIKS